MICDIAKYQGEIDWDALAPALDFVVIKASGKEKDPYFDRNAAEATARGVPWHAYHFLYCTTEARARADAKLFSDSVGAFKPLVWVLDCEAAWGVSDKNARIVAEAFEAELRRLRGADIRVGLYVAHQKYKDFALDYAHYDYVWIPRYRKVDVGLPNGPKPDHPCDVWQYSSKGKAPGISGNVDLDMLIGDKPTAYFTTGTIKESDTMKVIIGSARIDENGHATGGKAGDQTGKEVSIQNWYKHNKGWRVLRAKDPEAAEKIAQAMQWACDSSLIGYDQNQRETLRKAVMELGWDIRRLTTAVETDCSALVRVCCGWAFQKDLGTSVSYFNTTSMCSALLSTGLFDELTSSKYTEQQDYLKRGDILCTRTQGHTVVVLSNGSKAEASVAPAAPQTSALFKGAKGFTVKEMQKMLLTWKPDCLPKYGADGDFGSETEAALKAFQAANGLPVTGVLDEDARKVLEAVATHTPEPEPEPEPVPGCNNDYCPIDGVEDDAPEGPEWVLATGNVNVRSAPGTDARIIGVLHKLDCVPYQGESREWGGRPWYLVEFEGVNGWVSSKYAEVTVG